MDKGDKSKKKPLPQLGSESKPSEILAHELLAHEDKDPTYPFDPIIDSGKEKKKKSS